MSSIPVTAQQSQLDRQKQECNTALNACYKYIQSQEVLIAKLQSVANLKETQDEELTKALIQMKELNDKALETDIAIGAIGFALGVLAYGVVHK